MDPTSVDPEDLKPKIASATLKLEAVRTSRRIRSKISKINIVDARDEVVYNVVNALRPNGVPAWTSYMIGYNFADKHKNELCSPIPEENDSENISWNKWQSSFMNLSLKYLHALVTGSESIPSKPSNWDKFPFCTYEHRNGKSTMEDKKITLSTMSVIEPNKQHGYKDVALFAVFDGHGGPECADYATCHFPSTLIQFDPSTIPHEDLLKKSFDVIDKKIDNFCRTLEIAGGSTASVAMILNNTVHYAWVGDSGLGVLRKNEIVQLNIYHNLQLVSEEQRIVEAGGCVINIMGEPRVDGVLNITRAFGHPHAKSIIGVPDTGSFEITADDYLLFIASDGIWDSVTLEEMLNYVVQYTRECAIHESHLMASSIGELIRENSVDNCMLIIVFLKPVEDVWKHLSNIAV